MKKVILASLSLLLISLSYGQVSNMIVEWGDEIPAKRMLVSDLFSLQEPGTFYAINSGLRIRNRQPFLERYDDLQLTKKVELLSDLGRKESQFQDVIELNNNLYALTYRQNITSRSLTAQGIDPETLILSGSEEPIYNIKLTRGIRNTYGEYIRAISPNETKVAYVVEHPGDKTSASVATVKLFNDNFELLWNNKITLKSTKDLTSIYSITAGDKGTVYILTKVWKEKNERERKQRNYEFYLLAVTENGIQSEEKLSLEDNFIKELKLNLDVSGNLLCGGFYSKDGTRSDGVFYMTINSTDYKVNTVSLKEFGLDFLTAGMSEKAKRKTKKKASKGKDVGLSNVDFRDIIIKEDGGAVLVGEYVNIYTTTYTDANGNTRSTTHYNYDDIYVVNIDPAGNIEWAKKIQKIQHTTNDGGFYSSFFMVVSGEHLNFFFNVYEKRERKLHAVSMDVTGKMESKDIVSNNKKERIRIRPQSCEQISENEFILFGLSKKHNKFARVKIK